MNAEPKTTLIISKYFKHVKQKMVNLLLLTQSIVWVLLNRQKTNQLLFDWIGNKYCSLQENTNQSRSKLFTTFDILLIDFLYKTSLET